MKLLNTTPQCCQILFAFSSQLQEHIRLATVLLYHHLKYDLATNDGVNFVCNQNSCHTLSKSTDSLLDGPREHAPEGESCFENISHSGDNTWRSEANL